MIIGIVVVTVVTMIMIMFTIAATTVIMTRPNKHHLNSGSIMPCVLYTPTTVMGCYDCWCYGYSYSCSCNGLVWWTQPNSNALTLISTSLVPQPFIILVLLVSILLYFYNVLTESLLDPAPRPARPGPVC